MLMCQVLESSSDSMILTIERRGLQQRLLQKRE